ncbi:MAG: response regulator [Promethearchaeota archaeon]
MIENKKINILLIEDNNADIRLIKEFLRNSKGIFFNLESCNRLSEGLEHLKTKKFDLMLLDLTLPDSDRDSTLDKVLNFTKVIPIVILTGLDDREFALQSLQKGVQDYLVKNDLDENRLTRAILYGIERHRIENEKLREKLQKVQLDGKDKEILNLLQNNYKMSYKELSKKVNLAASTVHNRVQSMIKEGIIKKVDTIVDPSKAGYQSIAILGLSVDPLKLDDVVNILITFDEVQLVASSTGDHSLLIQTVTQNEKNLWKFINEKIKTMEGVHPLISVSSFIDIFKMTQKVHFKTE